MRVVSVISMYQTYGIYTLQLATTTFECPPLGNLNSIPTVGFLLFSQGEATGTLQPRARAAIRRVHRSIGGILERATGSGTPAGQLLVYALYALQPPVPFRLPAGLGLFDLA